MVKRCKCCGALFEITQDELSWLTEKGFSTFARCKPCRTKAKKIRRKARKAVEGNK